MIRFVAAVVMGLVALALLELSGDFEAVVIALLALIWAEVSA